MIGSPDTAPRRDDLPFLRHRRRPAAETSASPLADFIHSRGSRPSRAGDAPAASSAAAPAAGELDLSAPVRTVPAPAAGTGNELDLSPREPSTTTTPAAAGGPARPASTETGPRASAAPGAAAHPSTDAKRAARRRIHPGSPAILSPDEPVVTLTRLQSGIGVLTIDAACTPAVGDVRLGCAYQLTSGLSSIVQYASGITVAPPHSTRPVVIGGHGEFERITIDLLQSRSIERLIVYGFSDSGAELNWAGTLVTSTFGGDRIELPLARPRSSQVVVLLSIYNIDGEFVIRAEMEQFPGGVQAAVAAFDFDRITWLDQRTPMIAGR